MADALELPLSGKETELLMWAVAEIGDRPTRIPEDPSDPLAVLLAEGFPRGVIMTGARAVERLAHGDTIAAPESEVQRAILRVAVENSSWLQAYEGHSPAEHADNRKTLRGFAEKLDRLGIAVNFIPAK